MDGVERGPDGELRWVRRVPARTDPNRATFVQERRQRRSYRGYTGDPVTREDQPRRGLPSFQDIERLLEIYVATGEGRGAFHAAKVSEETKGPRYRYEEEIARRNRRRRHPPRYSSSDDDSWPDDGRPSHPRPSGGSSGGSSGGPVHPEEGPVLEIRRPGRRYDEEIRNIDVQTINPPRPVHIDVVRPRRGTEEIRNIDVQTINPVHFGVVRPRRGTEEGREEYSEHLQRRWRYQAYAEDVSDEEDGHGPLYAALPAEEDNIRLQSRRASSRRGRSSNRGVRGGGGLDYDPDEVPSDGGGQGSFRLRGGGASGAPPTRTSAVSGATIAPPGSEKIDTTPRDIE
jgi:hypothetical protein